MENLNVKFVKNGGHVNILEKFLFLATDHQPTSGHFEILVKGLFEIFLKENHQRTIPDNV
jgi:hypothetical protein